MRDRQAGRAEYGAVRGRRFSDVFKVHDEARPVFAGIRRPRLVHTKPHWTTKPSFGVGSGIQ